MPFTTIVKGRLHKENFLKNDPDDIILFFHRMDRFAQNFVILGSSTKTTKYANAAIAMLRSVKVTIDFHIILL